MDAITAIAEYVKQQQPKLRSAVIWVGDEVYNFYLMHDTVQLTFHGDGDKLMVRTWHFSPPNSTKPSSWVQASHKTFDLNDPTSLDKLDALLDAFLATIP